jgi:hypothetical protein
VFVNEPSFSTCPAHGIRKTSVPMSSGRSSPDWTSGESFQKRAVSVSARSRTTSHFRRAIARRMRPACIVPTAGVLAHREHAVDAAVEHPQHRRELRVVARDLRKVGEAEVVLGRRGVAEPCLQQRDDVLVEVRPPAAVAAARADVVLERQVALAGARHRQVAGQDVVERRDVARALDRRVPAHRHDPATRAADVAEQQLDDRAGADRLHAGRVLGPADGVGEHRRALATGVRDERLGDLEEELAGDPADLLDHLRRVAAVVARRIWKTQRGSCSDGSRRRPSVSMPAAVRSLKAWVECSGPPAWAAPCSPS